MRFRLPVPLGRRAHVHDRTARGCAGTSGALQSARCGAVQEPRDRVAIQPRGPSAPLPSSSGALPPGPRPRAGWTCFSRNSKRNSRRAILRRTEYVVLQSPRLLPLARQMAARRRVFAALDVLPEVDDGTAIDWADVVFCLSPFQEAVLREQHRGKPIVNLGQCGRFESEFRGTPDETPTIVYVGLDQPYLLREQVRRLARLPARLLLVGCDARAAFSIFGGPPPGDVEPLAWLNGDAFARAICRGWVGVLPYDPTHPRVRQSNPDKVYDYLMAGLQVIATEVPALVDAPGITTVRPEDLEGAVRGALAARRAGSGANAATARDEVFAATFRRRVSLEGGDGFRWFDPCPRPLTRRRSRSSSRPISDRSGCAAPCGRSLCRLHHHQRSSPWRARTTVRRSPRSSHCASSPCLSRSCEESCASPGSCLQSRRIRLASRRDHRDARRRWRGRARLDGWASSPLPRSSRRRGGGTLHQCERRRGSTRREHPSRRIRQFARRVRRSYVPPPRLRRRGGGRLPHGRMHELSRDSGAGTRVRPRPQWRCRIRVRGQSRPSGSPRGLEDRVRSSGGDPALFSAPCAHRDASGERRIDPRIRVQPPARHRTAPLRATTDPGHRVAGARR